jgi:hypothetical protein
MHTPARREEQGSHVEGRGSSADKFMEGPHKAETFPLVLKEQYIVVALRGTWQA